MHKEIEDLSYSLSDSEINNLIQIDDEISTKYLNWSSIGRSTVTLVDEDNIFPVSSAVIYEISGHKYVDKSEGVLVDMLANLGEIPEIIYPRIKLSNDTTNLDYYITKCRCTDRIGSYLSSRYINHLLIRTMVGIRYKIIVYCNDASIYYLSSSDKVLADGIHKDYEIIKDNILESLGKYVKYLKADKTSKINLW